MRINFDDIVISQAFQSTQPSQEKINSCKAAYKQGIYDRDLVLNHKNVLVDGYVLYCVLKEAGYKGDIEVKKSRTYVFGKHPNDDKERVWYINMAYNKAKNFIGHLAMVNTKQGTATIRITKVENLVDPPVNGDIKKVRYVYG